MNPTIETREFGRRPCLFLSFERHFSETDAQRAIGDLSSRLQGNSDRLTMVWECSRMTGYDKTARDLWQEFIKGLRPRIDAIHFISQNNVVRLGSTVVGMVAGIRIRAWSTLEEFQAGL